MKYYRDKQGHLREKGTNKLVEDTKPLSDPFMLSGMEDDNKFDDDYEDCEDLLAQLDSRMRRGIVRGVKSVNTAAYPGRRRGVYDNIDGYYYPNLP